MYSGMYILLLGVLLFLGLSAYDSDQGVFENIIFGAVNGRVVLPLNGVIASKVKWVPVIIEIFL